MRVFTLLVLSFLVSSARADGPASQPVEDKDPQVLGTGYIAEVCKLRFADPVGQTACEVHIRMELRDETRQRIEMLERENKFLFQVADEQKARAVMLEVRIKAIEDAEQKGKK
ncbi:MAG: hypothetical protein AAB337_02335 [Patescibacteria group bacterium]